MTISRRALLTGQPTRLDPARSDVAPHAVAVIQANCLPLAGIACGSCADACPEAAIRMRPRIGGPAVACVSDVLCTGCRICEDVCPVDAIASEGHIHA